MTRFFYSLLIACCCAASAYAADEQRRINVSSDEVEYSVDGKNAVFRGNVEVTAGGLRLQAATLHVEQEDAGNSYTAQAAETPLSVLCDDCGDFILRAEVQKQAIYNDRDDRLQLSGGVFVCADENCRRGELNAASADWQRGTQQLLLRGMPMVTGRWQPEDTPEPLLLQAREIVYHFDRQEAVLSGDAQVTRGGSNIAGMVIRVNTKTGALTAKSDSKQRVQATFDQ